MRMFVLAAAAAIYAMLTIAPLTTPAQAQQKLQNQWCAERKGATHCRYSTEQQCRASLKGRGGSCVQRRSSR